MKGTLPALGFGELLAETLIQPLSKQLEAWQEATSSLTPVAAMSVELPSQAGVPSFSDRVDELWRDGDGRLHRCELAPAHFGHLRRDRGGRLTQYGKPHRLMRAWLEQLAITAMGEPVATTLIFEDRQLTLPAMSADQARHNLLALCRQWRLALDTPLPTGPSLALEYYAAWPRESDAQQHDAYHQAGLARARQHYEEATFNGPAALCEREPMMGELWADFEALVAAGFEDHTRSLYEDFADMLSALVDGADASPSE